MSLVDLGPIGNFPVDQLCRVEVEKRALVVVRKEEAVYALRDICPHQGARLSGGHLTGRVRSYAARIEDGRVVVDMDR
jgi:nitrite reductase/ring-hydroxylating ferredoxin subunit